MFSPSLVSDLLRRLPFWLFGLLTTPNWTLLKKKTVISVLWLRLFRSRPLPKHLCFMNPQFASVSRDALMDLFFFFSVYCCCEMEGWEGTTPTVLARFTGGIELPLAKAIHCGLAVFRTPSFFLFFLFLRVGTCSLFNQIFSSSVGFFFLCDVACILFSFSTLSRLFYDLMCAAHMICIHV